VVRSTARKGSRRWLLAFLGLASLLCLWAAWIEPGWVEVTRHTLTARVAAPLKILHLTDLHTSALGRRERRLLALVEAERPDAIVITGDCPDVAGDYEAVHALVSRLRAPLGVFVVRGNWEHWRPLASRGLREHEFWAGCVTAGVWLAGFDDFLAGFPRVQALGGLPRGVFAIALFHSPAFFDELVSAAPGRCALSLAGHSHGGQVRLPFIGPLWLPPGCGEYSAGWYEAGGARLYVARGLGTSILPVRFLCRPEIALVSLVPE
jgi:predicted MPP superfamily phosphohydrolase